MYSEAVREISKLSEDDLHSLSMDLFQSAGNNPFMQFFTTLSEAVTPKPAKMPVQGREPSAGEISSSSDEDKVEDVARACLHELVAVILHKNGMASINANWSLRVSIHNCIFHVSGH